MPHHTIHFCDHPDCADPWCEDGEGYGPCGHGPSYCEDHWRECDLCVREWGAHPDHDWGATAAAGLRRLHDPDHGRMTHTGRAGDPA